MGVLLAVLGAAGCRGREVPLAAQPAASASTVAVVEAPPIDALLPGELAEGDEKALGLTLPRTTIVEKRFDDSVYGYGAYTVDEASKYFARRLDDARSVPSTSRTILKGRPRVGLNQPTLSIELVSSGGNTHFVVRDITAPAAEPGLTDEERWRRAGIGKDGRSIVTE